MSDYTINDIETLSFRDGVRKRIAMYLGSADMNGVYNAIQEIISNSIDEFYMGYGKQIIIALGADNLITIVDEGRGIPFGTKEDGSNVLVDIFSKAHTGGKFNDKVYNSVAGLNGIGAKATCLSSKKFSVGVWRDGVYAEAVFEKGELIKYTESASKDKKKMGTQIQFIPDEEVFNLEPIAIEFERLCKNCKNLSYLTKGLTFQLENYSMDSKKPTIIKYCAKNGLLDLIKDHVDKPVHVQPLYYETDEEDMHIEIAAQWTRGHEKSFVFTNGLHNSEGGTSLTGFRTSLTRNMNKLIKKNLSGEMVRTGLVYAVSVKIPNPSFANQTKTKINNPELRGFADRAVTEALNIFMKKWDIDFSAIKEFLIKEEKAENAAQRARDAVINNIKATQQAQKKKVLLADKLKDCEEHGEESILVISEGDSASGGLAQGRPIENVALMPIRGKIINALRHDIEEVLTNAEVNDIIITLGCGINEHYNAKRLRYGKVAIATDADADGYNIMCLITTLFYKLMPQFIEEGRLHWLRAPLYRVHYAKEDHYAFNDDNLNEILNKYGKGTITRFKGLGEMKPNDTRQSMFGKDQRLEKLTLNDKIAAYSAIEMLMGEEVADRRKFIFDNIDFSKLEE
jgi:DNA gyrase subunit B